MNKKIAAFKTLMQDLERIEKAGDIIDVAWDADPENVELEKAWDKNYEETHAAFQAAAAALAGLIHCDNSLACTMIRCKREQVNDILRRWKA